MLVGVLISWLVGWAQSGWIGKELGVFCWKIGCRRFVVDGTLGGGVFLDILVFWEDFLDGDEWMEVWEDGR